MKSGLLIACLCFGLIPAGAHAARPARVSEAKAINASVRAYARSCCRVERLTINAARISTVDPDFATVTIKETGTAGVPGPRATVVLVHTHSGRWTVIALGTARLACGISALIRHDLRLPNCA